jgi:hypothetical protein
MMGNKTEPEHLHIPSLHMQRPARTMRQPSSRLLTATSLFLLLKQAFGAEFGEKARPYWIAHGTLMFLAWGVIFPLGALVAVYRKHMGYNDDGAIFTWAPNFYLPHFYFQILGLVLNIVAFALAARGSFLEYDTGNPFADVLWNYETDLYPWNHHVKWGVSVLSILVRILLH